MSFDKRDYHIDGRRDFSDHSDDETSPSYTENVKKVYQVSSAASVLVELKMYAESRGVELFNLGNAEDLAHFVESRGVSFV